MKECLWDHSNVPMAFLSYQPLWSQYWRRISTGGWAPYTSKAGMLRSSTKNTKCFPSGGPNTPLRLKINTCNLNNTESKCGVRLPTTKFEEQETHSRCQKCANTRKTGGFKPANSDFLLPFYSAGNNMSTINLNWQVSNTVSWQKCVNRRKHSTQA